MTSNVNEYQGYSLDNSVKFYVAYNEDLKCFVADIFNSKIEAQDYGKAYVESFEFDTLAEAIADLKHYQLEFNFKDLKNV